MNLDLCAIFVHNVCEHLTRYTTTPPHHTDCKLVKFEKQVVYVCEGVGGRLLSVPWAHSSRGETVPVGLGMLTELEARMLG